jgi:hypothetical protein
MSSNTGCLLGGVIGIVIIVTFFGWLFDAAWFYKTFYTMSYDMDLGRVEIAKKPHDCEFMTAPLGEKNCHYQRVTNKVEWATNANGQPMRMGNPLGHSTVARRGRFKHRVSVTLTCRWIAPMGSTRLTT